MVINKSLDEVFSRWSHIAVMRALKNHAIGISGREVSRIAGITHRNSIEALTNLERFGIVIRVRGGRDHLFSLNREHYIVKNGILPLFEMEDGFMKTILTEVKNKLKGKCESVYLFGSTARKEEKPESDLDICIVYDKKNKKEEIEEAFFDLSLLLNKKYGVNASPYYITISEFLKKARSKRQPVLDIIKEGKLVSGTSLKELIYD